MDPLEISKVMAALGGARVVGSAPHALAELVALAYQALGNADEATDWLNEPHPLLGSARPIEVAATDLSARQVERILHNIEHSLPV